MEVKQLIGLRIKNLRRSKGLSQEELAEKMGISPKYLSSIERGKENPTLDTFIKLAEALNIVISVTSRYSAASLMVKEDCPISSNTLSCV